MNKISPIMRVVRAMPVGAAFDIQGYDGGTFRYLHRRHGGRSVLIVPNDTLLSDADELRQHGFDVSRIQADT
jgi:hypothetical protein